MPTSIELPAEKASAIDLTQMCNNLTKEMQNIDNTRTTFALEQVNQNLKICLPLTDFNQQVKWIALSSKMYDNFLKVNRTSEQQQYFDLHALDMAQYPTIQQNHFSKFSIRDQYLLKHKGQAYVELHDTGNGTFIYRRSPQYLARIFAPYLPQAEKIFIENLAEQNTMNLFNNHKLALEPNQISNRALFWENYVHKYPKSLYIKDAIYLRDVYNYLLFIGAPLSPVSTAYENTISDSHLNEIEHLATLNDSELSRKSKKFMDFVHSQERIQNQNDYSDLQEIKIKHQLINALQLPHLKFNKLRNCFSDAICH